MALGRGIAAAEPHGGLDERAALERAQPGGELVVAGDEISTTVTLAEVSERAGNGFFTFETRSVNQDGAEVSVGRWMNIVRGD